MIPNTKLALLYGLITEFGEDGYTVTVHYDARRKEYKWTVTLQYGILADHTDTNDPADVLTRWRQRHSSYIDAQQGLW